MNFIDEIKKALFESKGQSNFNITEQRNWDDYTWLTKSSNYLDQFYGWTYKAINTIGTSITNYNINLYQFKSNGEKVKIENHPILSHLEHFNDYQDYDEARYITLAHRRLVGLAFWLIQDSESPNYKYDFFILNPQRMTVRVDPIRGLPIGYDYTDSKGSNNFIHLEDLIVHREPDPSNWLTGQSVLQASRFSHNTWELASKFNMNMFGNRGMPEGSLTFEGISDAERERVEKLLKDKYGGVDQAGKIAIFNKLAKWIPFTQGQRELEYSKGITQLRDDILSMHGVPKPLVGLTDSTYTNSFEAQRIFQRYTLWAELKKECSVFNEQLFKKLSFGRTDGLKFIPTNPVEADKKSEAETSNILFGGNIITRNEARLAAGYEEVDNGNIYFQDIVKLNIPPNQEPIKGIAEIKKSIVRMSKIITQIPDVKEAMEKTKNEFREFFAKQHDANEDNYEESVKKYLDEQKSRILEQFKPKKQLSIDLQIDVEDETKLAVREMTPAARDIANETNNIANQITGDNIQLSAEEYQILSKNLEQSFTEINETTRDELLQIMANAIEEGKNEREVAQEITQLYNTWIEGGEGITTSRARTIARTETTKIMSYIERNNYSRSNEVASLEWLTAQDSFVRGSKPGDKFSHVEANGQVVPKGQKFRVSGEFLAFPGDPVGSPGNTINCRCDILPVLK